MTISTTNAARILRAAFLRDQGEAFWLLNERPYQELRCSAILRWSGRCEWALNCEPIDRETARIILSGLLTEES